LSKIAENFDHNIDPRLGQFSVIVYFVQLFKNKKEPASWGYFFHGCGYALSLTKMAWASFRAIFSQTHKVTLIINWIRSFLNIGN
jgi:hypothetical protein